MGPELVAVVPDAEHTAQALFSAENSARGITPGESPSGGAGRLRIEGRMESKEGEGDREVGGRGAIAVVPDAGNTAQALAAQRTAREAGISPGESVYAVARLLTAGRLRWGTRCSGRVGRRRAWSAWRTAGLHNARGGAHQDRAGVAARGLVPRREQLSVHWRRLGRGLCIGVLEGAYALESW